MDPAKTAVAHDQHLGSWFGLSLNGGERIVEAVADLPTWAERRRDCAQIPAQIGRLIQHHGVGQRQRRSQTVLEHAQLHGVGTWFQYRDDRLRTDPGAQTGQRGGNCGRMVGEIVVDRHAVDCAARFQSPLHALKVP